MLVAASAGLLAIWPIPETMTLRYVLLMIGLGASIFIAYHEKIAAIKTSLKALTPLILFFLWILVHYTFFSTLKDAQLGELTGFWLRSFISLLIGASLGIVFNSSETTPSPTNNTFRSLFILGLFGTFSIYLARYAYEVYVTGQLIHTDFHMTPFKGKPQIIVFSTILLTLLYAKLSEAIDKKEKSYWTSIPLIGIILILFIFYTANTKNGFLIFAAIFLVFIAKILSKKISDKKILVSFLVALMPLIIIGYRHVDSNPAWRMLLPDIKAGFEIEKNTFWRNWIDGVTPMNELGVPTNQSTYLRTAWVVAATKLIQENPLGYGLMSYSFTYLAQDKWPDFDTKSGQHMVATHSGWVDLTLALGIPAIALLLFSLWRSFSIALNSSGFWNRYIVWTVPTITLTYMVVEVSYDIFYELLLFLAGFFAILTSKRP